MKQLSTNVQELSHKELSQINGGFWPTIIRETIKWGSRLLTATAVYDAIEELKEGMDSVVCKNN